MAEYLRSPKFLWKNWPRVEDTLRPFGQKRLTVTAENCSRFGSEQDPQTDTVRHCGTDAPLLLMLWRETSSRRELTWWRFTLARTAQRNTQGWRA